MGRLEEIGIQIGVASEGDKTYSRSPPSFLNLSVGSSSSSSCGGGGPTDPLGVSKGVRPEVTLARFLIQVTGAACSKLHQMAYSQPDHQSDCAFLRQELSHLLLFVCYMLQSGRYARVAKAAAEIAASTAGSSDLPYSVEAVSELFLQLSHHSPYLTLQWLYTLLLIKWCPQEFWARVLTPGKHDDDVIIRVLDCPDSRAFKFNLYFRVRRPLARHLLPA